jgi:dipeptidyl aminopeptidase/acylaminoacyl peptidase
MTGIMQSKFQSLLRSKPVTAVGLVLTFALAATVGVRNYRSASLDFEPWPGSDLLQHPERTLLPGLQRVWFRSQGLRLSGWYIRSRNGAAVIVTHGTNADRTSMLYEMRTLAGAGFGVLAFDWPGDGASTGEIHWGPAERHALTAAIDWLGTRPDVDPERIGGLGFSMGGYVMAQVAAGDSRLRAVVLEALPPSFDEYLDHLHDKWGMLSRMPARWAVRQAGMDTTALAPRNVVAGISPRPILIIGGSDDPVISPAMLRELYDAAREPKQLWLVPQALHGGYSQAAAAEYSRRLLAFFDSGLRR